MGKYLLRRLVSIIPVVLIVTCIVFALQLLSPGDPITMLVPIDDLQTMSSEDIQQIRQRHGLDRPIPIQYLNWLWNAVQGDLGQSIRTGESVATVIVSRLPVTLELTVLSLVVSIVFAVPLGILSAYRRNSFLDVLASGSALAGASAPNFWLALLLVLLFTVSFDWLPPSGYVPMTEDPVANLRHMILPVITLATALMALTMRVTRSAMLEVLDQDYVRTARAKGLSETVTLTRHAFKNSLIPVVTVVGLQFGTLLGGAFIIEQIFAIPGIGKTGIDAVFNRDYPVVQGIVLLAIFVRIAANITADLVTAYLDPRIRF